MSTPIQKIDYSQKSFFERAEEWELIENLVTKYKSQFDSENHICTKKESEKAGRMLLKCFTPLLMKYQILIKTGSIDFKDLETRRFVKSFIGDKELKNTLKSSKISASDRMEISRRFNFIRETYGTLDEDIIMGDLQLSLLTLAKRYRQIGYNFCAYVYNSYLFEISRLIKKYTSDPANAPYRNLSYDDFMIGTPEEIVEDDIVEQTYEDEYGMPDITWTSGESCSETFACLSPIERKIISKYYLENFNDRQISKALGVHINTINQKRRAAVRKIADAFGVTENDVVRSRNSGKKTVRSMFI